MHPHATLPKSAASTAHYRVLLGILCINNNQIFLTFSICSPLKIHAGRKTTLALKTQIFKYCPIEGLDEYFLQKL